MKVWLAYRKLTAGQQRIVDTQRVDTKATPDELITLLGPVAAFDKTVGTVANSTALGCVAVVGFIAFIGCGIALASGGWSTPLAAAAVISLVSGVLGFRMISAAKKVDISDNLRGTLLPLLKILREDIPRGEKIALNLDLHLPTHAKKKTGTSKPYKRGAYYHIVDTNYEDPWLLLKAPLNDGSLLALRVADSIRVINRTKRGSSGKIRSNTRERKKTRVRVLLGVRRKDFNVTQPKDARVKVTDKRVLISLSRQLRFTDLNPVPPKSIIDAIADVYRGVQPVGRTAHA